MTKFFQSSAHWYQYEKGVVTPMHDADLVLARSLGLFTSPSSVLRVFSSDGLDNYRLDELFRATRDNPPFPNETEESHRGRVAELAEAHMKEAQEFGSGLHAALDDYPQISMDARFYPWVDEWGRVFEKIVEHKIASEERLADPDIGVAGTTDLIVKLRDGRTCLMDHKSSSWRNGKASFYPNHARQLAFYAKAYQKKHDLEELPCIANVGHNRDKAEPPQIKWWTQEEQETAYLEFLLAAYLWFGSKRGKKFDGYWPVGQWSLTVKVGEKEIYP